MIEKIFNDDKLSIDEMDEIVTRVKAVIINSKEEILLGYSHKTYQFPGGHVEPNETNKVALERELKEELGIDLKIKNEPFMKITYLTRNYRNTNKNRQNEIYYFIINTDLKPNMKLANLDQYEKEGNYTPVYLLIDNIEDILKKSIPDNPINEIIVKEMLEVINIVTKN